MTKGRPKIIAVDGPAGSGKSSLCKQVCDLNNWTYVNTGALYRAVAFIAHKRDMEANPENLKRVVEDFSNHYRWSPDEGKLYYKDEELNPYLHSREVGEMASAVAKSDEVRQNLLPLQRDLALNAPRAALLDGRDIGTVVFPDADLKIFMTASLEERAKRRLKQLDENDSGNEKKLAALVDEIGRRDQQDRNRSNAPLTQAEDAILVDTTDLDVEQSLDKLNMVICSKLPGLC